MNVRCVQEMPPRKSRAKKKKTPAHYRSLTLRNFRGFKKADKIPLRPLTFLVGPNSAGKSSLFDALLVIAQSDFGIPWVHACKHVWSGPLVDLGSYKDAVYWHDVNLQMVIGVEFEPDPVRPLLTESVRFGPVALEYRMRRHKANPECRLTSIDIPDIESGERFGVGW
ncbi:MAG: AAA family ATPase, partial [Planctomycetes bacterium]|nr:AAA family ATPase [Planctomycetota bacterium]